MQPYGYMQPQLAAGPIGQPMYPAMGGLQMATPVGPQIVYLQPPQGDGGGRRGRGRGVRQSGNTPRTRGLVTRLKSELQAATPGQLLEVARYAAAMLSHTNADLYSQLVTGLGVRGSSIQPDPQTERLVVADRKREWVKLCEGNEAVRYWQQTVNRLKEQFGSNAAVDELVLTDKEVDVRAYYRGKQVREDLLAKCRLYREGSTLRAMEGGDTDSNIDADTPIPTTSGVPFTRSTPSGYQTASGGYPMREQKEHLPGIIPQGIMEQFTLFQQFRMMQEEALQRPTAHPFNNSKASVSQETVDKEKLNNNAETSPRASTREGPAPT